MRRLPALLGLALAALALLAPAAKAAVPTLGPVSVTNVQGVSALLGGTVDPEGLAATYRFEYSTSPSFAGSALTAPAPAGSGPGPRPARAQISGLVPSTTYHYRLVATNASGTATGTAASFVTSAGFGFEAGSEGFAVGALVPGGAPATVAGSHPYQLEIGLGLRQGGSFEDQPGVPFADGDLRDLEIELAPGMLLNPRAAASCATAAFNTPRASPFEGSRSGESCPASSQVGTVEVHTSRDGGQGRRFGVFNLEAPRGVAAQLGFAPYGAPIVLSARLRALSQGRYSVVLSGTDVPQALDLLGLELVLWGTPWATSHHGERGNCLNEAEPDFPWAKCPVTIPDATNAPAYLTLPVQCSPALAFTARASSWQQGGEAFAAAVNRDALEVPQPLGGCSTIAFNPASQGALTTRRASSGSGFEFAFGQDQSGFTEPHLRSPAPLRRTVVSLPAGVTVNPSVGSGLGACTPAQLAAETPFNGQGPGCPNAAKIGKLEVKTPLLAEPLQGAVYLAAPDEPGSAAPGAENPFDSLIALYLVVKSPAAGLLIEVAGRVAADPQSGRLLATFEDLPQLPYSQVTVSFHHGQRPFLVSPPACGAARTGIEMVPWAGAGATEASTVSAIDAGADAGPCPGGEAAPFSPGVVTGALNANVGSYTPYFVHISRRDTEQEITSYSLVLPKGVTGKLAGIPFCAEAAIAAARSKRGFAEIAEPSCPPASQVGRTTTGYGVGASLAYAPGKIYLAGPYNGQPLSLVSVNAATIGPFDLGTYVIRSAFAVDPKTAQLRIDAGASDPIPHIVDGIPLHVRDIRIHMDRFEFTHNPSSCAASELRSTVGGSGARFGDPADDSRVTVSRHFQLLNCLVLGFRPKLGLRLRGGTRRGSYPSLRATFAARGPQDSNLKRIEVITPRAMFLAQEHIRDVCTRPQFEAERCPPGSIYGKAVAHTPLFDQPLRGPVYLRSSTSRLPHLVASLRSGAVRIVLEGRIGPSRHGIRTFFDEVPDAPISRFTMTLFGGKRGLLVNSADVCKRPPLASVKALAQNNIGAVFSSELRGQCEGEGKGKESKGKRGGRR